MKESPDLLKDGFPLGEENLLYSFAGEGYYGKNLKGGDQKRKKRDNAPDVKKKLSRGPLFTPNGKIPGAGKIIESVGLVDDKNGESAAEGGKISRGQPTEECTFSGRGRKSGHWKT